jgi:hypothetical protein
MCNYPRWILETPHPNYIRGTGTAKRLKITGFKIISKQLHKAPKCTLKTHHILNVSKKIANSGDNYHLTFHKMQVKLETISQFLVLNESPQSRHNPLSVLKTKN